MMTQIIANSCDRLNSGDFPLIQCFQKLTKQMGSRNLSFSSSRFQSLPLFVTKSNSKCFFSRHSLAWLQWCYNNSVTKKHFLNVTHNNYNLLVGTMCNLQLQLQSKKHLNRTGASYQINNLYEQAFISSTAI